MIANVRAAKWSSVSFESLSVAVSVATLLVVAAAAVAAIVQLRHLRASNQLAGLLEIMNQWNIPAVQVALAELQRVPDKLADPEYEAIVRTPGAADRAQHPEFLALDLWEQIGTYCKYRLIDERILLDIVSAQVGAAWHSAQPLIEIVRERRGPSVFENFEYVAVRAKLWERRLPNGSYPPSLPRMKDLMP